MDLFTISRVVVFFFGSILIIYFSRRTLRNIKVHGFYRFFVFEFSLLQVLINIPFWFVNPFSFQQIFSWIFLSISLYLLFLSVLFLKMTGGNKKRDNDSANFNFEDTANLVKDGIYKYIRHPMYGSLLFLSFGTLLKNISVITLLLTMGIILFLIFTAKVEEKENVEFFGSSYLDYMKETKMFIPFIF